MIKEKRLFPNNNNKTGSQFQRDLPRIMEVIRNNVIKNLNSLLVEMFDRADDVLFDHADKACSDKEQSMFFNSMRELRI
ncbi:MAG: DUF1631 domain-containing protein [Gammaproteobacteria bacterium]|nr:DUF1631 domain-containing protein [Gammaproteobacteria bacterium]